MNVFGNHKASQENPQNAQGMEGKDTYVDKATADSSPLSDDKFDAILHDDRRIQEELEMYGRKKGASNSGDPATLESQMETIYEAYKRTSSKKSEVTAKDRHQTEGEIKEMKSKEEELRSKRERVEKREQGKIADLKAQVAKLRQRLENVREEQLEMPSANSVLEGFGWIVCVGLGLFLAIFYINAIYRAFYGTVSIGNGPINQNELQSLLNDTGVFKRGILVKGLKAFLPPFFIFIPFALAASLHYIWDNLFNLSKAGRNWSLFGVLVTAFLLDGLIAYRIHDSMVTIKRMMGQDVPEFYEDTNFYLILFCGFGAILFWSFLFHGVMVIRNSRNPHRIRKNKESNYRRALEEKESELKDTSDGLEYRIDELENEMAECRQKIVSLEAGLEDDGSMVITYDGKLKLCLQSFYSGWVSTVKFLGGDLVATQAAFDTFLARHFTRTQSLSERQEQSTNESEQS